jgi:hypothetical protein
VTDDASYIGPLRIPLRSNGYPSPISDPTITGFLDYFRFWIRHGLGQKIGDPNDTQPDALPEEHLFDFDPGDNWTRLLNSDGDPALPALFLWQAASSKPEQHTIVRHKRTRTFRIMYVAKPIDGPEGSPVFSGLGSAIDAILTKAYARGRHPHYGYNGSARGTSITESLNLLGWSYEGGQPGMMAPVPGTSPRIGGPSGGNQVQYFPAMLGAMTVVELVEDDEQTTDGPQDIPFDIRINDPANPDGPLSILDRTLESPVGANGE